MVKFAKIVFNSRTYKTYFSNERDDCDCANRCMHAWTTLNAFHSKFLNRKHKVFCPRACRQLPACANFPWTRTSETAHRLTAREKICGSWFTMWVSNRPMSVLEIFQHITQTVKYNDNQLLNKVQTKIIFSFKNYIHHHHFSKLYLLRPYKKEPRLHKRMYPLFHHTHLSILYANGSETCDKPLPAAIPPCI